jgi:hypothetical protein
MRERLASSVVLQALASALGLVFALPFAYVMVVEWLGVVRMGGWLSYLTIGWAVVRCGGLAIHLLNRRYYFIPLLLDSDYRDAWLKLRAQERSHKFRMCGNSSSRVWGGHPGGEAAATWHSADRGEPVSPDRARGERPMLAVRARAGSIEKASVVS